MKSLLIIKKIISSYKAELQSYKNLLSSIDDDAVDDVLLDIFYLEESIKVLKLIKNELEAWDAIKKHLESFSVDYFNGLTEYGILMTSKVNDNEYQIIKKALDTNEK